MRTAKTTTNYELSNKIGDFVLTSSFSVQDDLKVTAASISAYDNVNNVQCYMSYSPQGTSISVNNIASIEQIKTCTDMLLNEFTEIFNSIVNNTIVTPKEEQTV